MPKRGIKIVCRCEEITEEEVIEWIRKGYRTPEELKRILRIGMGHCQGRSCLWPLVKIISRETKIPVSDIALPKKRPPLKPIAGKILATFRNQGDC